MKKKVVPSDSLQRQYQRLCSSLANSGYISQGSVVDRSRLRPARSGYQWTRKVTRKTITVALSPEQFYALRQAIKNRRTLQHGGLSVCLIQRPGALQGRKDRVVVQAEHEGGFGLLNVPD